jgi:hypothetical protein
VVPSTVLAKGLFQPPPTGEYGVGLPGAVNPWASIGAGSTKARRGLRRFCADVCGDETEQLPKLLESAERVLLLIRSERYRERRH